MYYTLHSGKPANRNQGGKTEKKSEHKAQKIEQQTSLQQDTFLQQELAQPLPSQSRVNGFAAPAALLTALEGCAQWQSRKASPPSAPGSVFSVWRYGRRRDIHLIQILFHPSIINAQKLRGTGNRINIEMLSFGSLFVHETEDGVFRISAAQRHAANLK